MNRQISLHLEEAIGAIYFSFIFIFLFDKVLSFIFFCFFFLISIIVIEILKIIIFLKRF